MKWRDELILAAAKRMYIRNLLAVGVVANVPEELAWENLSDRSHWIKAATEAIRDIRDGAEDAGWTVEFTKEGWQGEEDATAS